MLYLLAWEILFVYTFQITLEIYQIATLKWQKKPYLILMITFGCISATAT